MAEFTLILTFDGADPLKAAYHGSLLAAKAYAETKRQRQGADRVEVIDARGKVVFSKGRPDT